MMWPSRTHSLRSVAAVALALAGTLLAAADVPYADPWDPATVAAAEAAVARLGARRALALRPSVLSITGLPVGITGAGTGVVATVQQVQQAMRELGARETALQVEVDLPADVLFDFDKADIRADAARALARLATLIRAYPAGRTLLEGHTDAKGTDAYNDSLSRRRAEAVKAWLVEKEGIAADRLATRGWGKRKPVASNTTEDGRQKNRRVVAVIRKQG